MKLYKKEGNTVQILGFPTEEIEKGEYLLIEDFKHSRSLVIQVIDIQFANIPGILEEFLRNSTDEQDICGETLDPLEVTPHITHIQDARMFICKIRGTIQNGEPGVSTAWLPSRSQSHVRKLSTASLLTQAKISGNLPINLGETKDSSSFP